jgi:glucosylceramidase
VRDHIFFLALTALAIGGCGGDGSQTVVPTPAATPAISPAPGIVNPGQSVTISDTTPGANIYYTTDGSTPTTASSLYTSAIPLTVNTTVHAIAAASGYTTSATASAAYQIAGPAVAVVLTTHDQSQLLAPQTATLFTATTAGTNNILVDESQQFQSIEGFGAAFTDSAAYLLYQVVPTANQPAVLSDLFTRAGNGIGLSFMRVPIGSTDIARSLYTFDDMPQGQTDPTLANFSIAHDLPYIVPLIKQAKSLNPQMKLFATPWSPPAWMKSNDSVIAGTLNASAYASSSAPFGQYLVKYLQAYQAQGIAYDYLSLENEPLYLSGGQYPNMYMDALTQTAALDQNVLPALTAAGLSTKILVYDHNWDVPAYPSTVLSDPTVAASPLVAGTAWHGYGGVPGAQQLVQDQFPAYGAWETELSGGTWVKDQFTSDFLTITLVLRNSGKSFLKWSLALDQTMGPNLTELNNGLGGCATCTPLVTVNNSTGAVTKDVEFYTLGQYSKFVLQGAKRIWSSNNPAIATVAFENPDASKVLIAFNNTSSAQSFNVQWGGQSFSATLPSLSAATFTWSGTQSAAAQIPATSQIQASSFSSVSGLQTENTSDSTGAYDLGYVNPGAWAQYKNVNFGTGVSTVNVRTAAPTGAGGTLEFHLDSITGTLIATATLPPTGGYQTWQTVSAPVTGASALHDLYIVFRGASPGVANLNWFQFQ